MTVSKRPIVVVQVREQRDVWTGSVSMPEHLRISDDGKIVSHLGAKPVTRTMTKIFAHEDRLQLVVEKPRDKSDVDEMTLTLLDDNHASLVVVGEPMKPWRLTRTAGDVAVFEDWDPEQSYAVDSDPASWNR